MKELYVKKQFNFFEYFMTCFTSLYFNFIFLYFSLQTNDFNFSFFFFKKQEGFPQECFSQPLKSEEVLKFLAKVLIQIEDKFNE